MPYEAPQRELLYLASAAIGAGAVSMKFRGPATKKGIVRDIEMIPSADMVGTTTVPEINVGATAGSTEYARFRLGTTAIAGYTSAQGVRRARTLVTGNPTPPTLSDFTGHVALETARIPADTDVFFGSVAGVGGTPAGTAICLATVDWF